MNKAMAKRCFNSRRQRHAWITGGKLFLFERAHQIIRGHVLFTGSIFVAACFFFLFVEWAAGRRRFLLLETPARPSGQLMH